MVSVNIFGTHKKYHNDIENPFKSTHTYYVYLNLSSK